MTNAELRAYQMSYNYNDSQQEEFNIPINKHRGYRQANS